MNDLGDFGVHQSIDAALIMKNRLSKILILSAACVIAVAAFVIAQRNPNPLPGDFRAEKVLVEKGARRLSAGYHEISTSRI